ncbi:hypothetical protein BgiMline_002698 [Biomphalaria glabrata]
MRLSYSNKWRPLSGASDLLSRCRAEHREMSDDGLVMQIWKLSDNLNKGPTSVIQTIAPLTHTIATITPLTQTIATIKPLTQTIATITPLIQTIDTIKPLTQTITTITPLAQTIATIAPMCSLPTLISVLGPVPACTCWHVSRSPEDASGAIHSGHAVVIPSTPPPPTTGNTGLVGHTFVFLSPTTPSRA